MICKEILEQTRPESAFLEHLEAQILKKLPLTADHSSLPSWGQYLYWTAKKKSAYVTIGR